MDSKMCWMSSGGKEVKERGEYESGGKGGEEEKEDKKLESSFQISTKSKNIKAMNPTSNGNRIPSR